MAGEVESTLSPAPVGVAGTLLYNAERDFNVRPVSPPLSGDFSRMALNSIRVGIFTQTLDNDFCAGPCGNAGQYQSQTSS